jgi:hypothetical protein
MASPSPTDHRGLGTEMVSVPHGQFPARERLWRCARNREQHRARAAGPATLRSELVKLTVAALKAAPIGHFKAKDILRSSPVAPAAGRQRACRSRPGEGHQRATTFPGSVGSRCLDQRLPVTDRRRLPPGLRELSPRREHRHSLPDRGPARGVIQHRRPEVALRRPASGRGRDDRARWLLALRASETAM